MKITWHIRSSDVEKVKEFFNHYRHDREVIHRIARNLRKQKPRVTKREFWKRLVGCLLTTRQRSGPGSLVRRFLDTKPFPLRYGLCVEHQSDLAAFAEQTIRSFGGLRFAPKIGLFVAGNLTKLEDGGWNQVFEYLNQIRRKPSRENERSAAEHIDEVLVGFGPKQSRNLLQALGLTRYEIPLDSRVTDWLNEFGFPVELTAAALQDRNYYNFVSDGLQALCKACNIAPCLLDAAIFVDVDTRRENGEL